MQKGGNTGVALWYRLRLLVHPLFASVALSLWWQVVVTGGVLSSGLPAAIVFFGKSLTAVTLSAMPVFVTALSLSLVWMGLWAYFSAQCARYFPAEQDVETDSRHHVNGLHYSSESSPKDASLRNKERVNIPLTSELLPPLPIKKKVSPLIYSKSTCTPLAGSCRLSNNTE